MKLAHQILLSAEFDHLRLGNTLPYPSGELTEELIGNLRALNDLAQARNQTLAQMALAWVLRGGRVTTALIGASSAQQVVDCAQAVENIEFTASELAEIDLLSGDQGINLWAQSSETA